jgi:hypothetical protein
VNRQHSRGTECISSCSRPGRKRFSAYILLSCSRDGSCTYRVQLTLPVSPCVGGHCPSCPPDRNRCHSWVREKNSHIFIISRINLVYQKRVACIDPPRFLTIISCISVTEVPGGSVSGESCIEIDHQYCSIALGPVSTTLNLLPYHLHTPEAKVL